MLKPSRLKAPTNILKPRSTALKTPAAGNALRFSLTAIVAPTENTACSVKTSSTPSSETQEEFVDDFRVGERVWVNGNKPGFIQFLGETQFAPGQWAGIILDEPIGKNDGSVAGARYFQCEPLKGIFTRPSKLTREARAGAEADGPQTTPAARAPSPPSTSAVSIASSSPATPSHIPRRLSQPTAKEPSATSQISNLTKTASKSISNLLEAGSIKKGERELKIGDRVLKEKFADASEEAVSFQRSMQDMKAKFRERDERKEQLLKAKKKLENDIAAIMKMSGDKSSQLTKMNDELRLKERDVEELQLKLTKANENTSLLQKSIGEVTLKAEQSQKEAGKKHEEEKKELLRKLSYLEKKMEMSRNECQDLKARYEEASSESRAKHEEVLQNVHKLLRDTEERLKAAQEENRELLQKLEELGKQAEGAKATQTTGDAMQIREQMTKEETEMLASLEDSRQTDEKLKNELDTLKENNLKNVEELNKSKELLMVESQKIEELKKEIETLRQAAAEKSQQLSALQEENVKLNEELERSRDEVTSHQKLEEERSVLNNQLLEMKKRESKLIKDADEEKASLQKSISFTSALLTEKDADLLKLRNEVTVLRGENASAKSLHSVVESLETDKVKLELKVKNLELQLKENKMQLSSSSGNTDTQAEEDERAQESRLGILNSIIVDLLSKNQDLQMKVEMMSEAALNGDGDDLNNYDSDDQEKQSKKKPRLFCDICDCFDLHDTEDCPTQSQMSEDPPHSAHHGSRSEERPYCEICEMFGHWATNCNDEETF
ncbi:unnamed protein product [Rangifer tarandus platyrhynchus]|uniref:Uncharacterized protein n=1 Tax=Rangifer tarandus platyrhynchus TaxID=3082113 RepID=A0AC59YGB9_RANTA